MRGLINVKRFVFAIYVAVIGVLVTATVLEKVYGTPFVMEHIYGAWWFIALWALLGVGCIKNVIIKVKGQRSKVKGLTSIFQFFNSSVFLHGSFVLILVGALVTHLFGVQGTVHLRKGESTVMMLNDEKKMVEYLPFSVTLKDFQLKTYQGTQTPKDYVSVITTSSDEELVVSMNNVGSCQSYRFYQSGYDSDLQGTYLSLSHDPWGIGITYTGYALLLISMLWMMIRPLGVKVRTSIFQSFNSLIFIALCFLPFAFVSCTALQPFAERVYAIFNHLRPLAIVLLSVGFVNYIFTLVYTSRQRPMPRWFTIQFPVFCVVAFVYLLLFTTLRTIIAGHIPLTNGFEVMLFMSMCSLAIGLAGRGTSIFESFNFSIFLIVSSLTLLVATMSQSDSQIEPIAPVLDSPLLSIHVSLVMLAYTLFAFLALNSLTVLVSRQNNQQSTINNQLKLAVFLLAAGIILGAIWANQSWGRYWGWDPKEVWALITLMVYAIPLHASQREKLKIKKLENVNIDSPKFPLKGARGPFFYHLYLVLAFLSVIITYFGVNFFLGGMHSYANG